MDVIGLLKTFPAILGLAGLFAYLWYGQAKVGGKLFQNIVTKLRRQPHLQIKDYETLSPARVKSLAEADKAIKDAVNDQDWRLLELLVKRQHSLTMAALLVSAALVGLSIWLISRPAPLSISPRVLSNPVKRAEGTLVDVDPILAEWTSDGPAERVSVFLENVDTGRRSVKKEVASDARSVTFSPEDFKEALGNRQHHGSNRLRSVTAWSHGTATSELADVAVGLIVEVLLNVLAIIDGKAEKRNLIVTTIDGSTQNMPRKYCFSGDLILRDVQRHPVVMPLGTICNDGDGVNLGDKVQIDWSARIGFVYNGPDDPKLVRVCVHWPGPQPICN